jgi:hypothetical protein
MDDFTPISEAEFTAVLADAVTSLEEPQRSTYHRYRVSPYRQECWRSELYGTEHVFVCARSGDALIFFDDAEDEFAVGVPERDGVLRSWGLFGELSSALYAFPDSARHARTTSNA